MRADAPPATIPAGLVDDHGNIQFGRGGAVAVKHDSEDYASGVHEDDTLTWFASVRDLLDNRPVAMATFVGDSYRLIVDGSAGTLIDEDGAGIMFRDMRAPSTQWRLPPAVMEVLDCSKPRLGTAGMVDQQLAVYFRCGENRPAGLALCDRSFLRQGEGNCSVIKAPKELSDFGWRNARGGHSRNERARIDTDLPGCAAGTFAVVDRTVTWMVSPGSSNQVGIPALGALGCSGSDVLAYRYSRIDRWRLPWTATNEQAPPLSSR